MTHKTEYSEIRTVADIRDQLSILLQDAMRSARETGFKFYRSRGIDLVASNGSGRVDPPNPYYGWNRTRRELRSFIDVARPHGATRVCFVGGIDGSDFFDFGDYTPNIEVYELCLPIEQLVPMIGCRLKN